METWYNASIYSTKITEVFVVRETESTIWVEGKKSGNRKKTDYGGYFKTIQECKDFILSHYTKEIESAERTLAYRKENLAKAEKLLSKY